MFHFIHVFVRKQPSKPFRQQKVLTGLPLSSPDSICGESVSLWEHSNTESETLQNRPFRRHKVRVLSALEAESPLSRE